MLHGYPSKGLQHFVELSDAVLTSSSSSIPSRGFEHFVDHYASRWQHWQCKRKRNELDDSRAQEGGGSTGSVKESVVRGSTGSAEELDDECWTTRGPSINATPDG